jgi:gluconate 5-dehydrogenase
MRAPELFDLTNKVAIVTGGGSGLGLQMARALGECGARLVLCARKQERCLASAAELHAEGIDAIGLRCDVRDPAEVAAVVDRAHERFGRLDVLVNNAGTSWKAAPEDVPLDAWNKVLDANLKGTFLFSQAFGRRLIERNEGGKIVNITSFTAFRGLDPEDLDAVPYSTSKGGVVSLTLDLAVKWARHGIYVNAIAPGWFRSDMTEMVLQRTGDAFVNKLPLGRLGGPDDLKGAVVYLASPASDYTTGQVLAVDGGALARW